MQTNNPSPSESIYPIIPITPVSSFPLATRTSSADIPHAKPNRAKPYPNQLLTQWFTPRYSKLKFAYDRYGNEWLAFQPTATKIVIVSHALPSRVEIRFEGRLLDTLTKFYSALAQWSQE